MFFFSVGLKCVRYSNPKLGGKINQTTTNTRDVTPAGDLTDLPGVKKFSADNEDVPSARKKEEK